ncbi:hypothetical protein OIU79_019337 [Salix purpurea]|uniref:Uncharacterized protein n=1 Tax=Salix purpurea TaxID=77065 RepID=A0A9Q0SJ03_SALPP|nr:hypothetical protein OIU79_019337 [Salix purpurea]
MKKAPGTTVFDGMAHMGTKPCGTAATVCGACGCGGRVVMGAKEAEIETLSLTSTYSLLAGRLRFFFALGSSGSPLELVVVGILRVPLTDMAIAGTVPVPVAAIIAAHVAGIRILLPRPSTLVCRSLVEARFGGVTVVSGMGIAANGMTANGGVGGLSSVHGSSFGAADMLLQLFLLVGPTRMFGNSPLSILEISGCHAIFFKLFLSYG